MPSIPDLIAPDPKVQKRIDDGVHVILERLQTKGLIPAAVTGEKLVANPGHMSAFINLYKKNRDLGAGVLEDKAGNLVGDDQTLLDCGFTAAQLERYLVIRCARQAYADFGGPTKGKVPEELIPWLAFAWQLPLLSAIVRKMDRYQFGELGEDMLFIKTPAHAMGLTGASAAEIRRVRELLGDRFEEMMQANPAAIRGVANCDEQIFNLFVKISGDRLWSFLGGDQQLVVELIGAEKKRLLSLGPNFPDLCVDTFRVLEEIPTPMLAPFMRSFDKVFGKLGRALLGDKQFAREFLAGVVDVFRQLNADGAKQQEVVSEAAVLKWNALKPRLFEWVKANKQK